MYSFNNFSLRDHGVKVMSDSDDWGEVIIKVLPETGKLTNPSASIRTISLFKPIKVYQSNFTLKVNIELEEKINIKITDNTGAPVYLRQLTPASSNEVLISTSSWNYGEYNITLTNSACAIIATGKFSIH
ncbi:archaellin [Dysgonomonas hofstadii]|uniref:Archaellin n=2 Tax=Dysgonomonas hofstadii TaxID=637886 RepID=A0A840CNY2_9BACT|nr:archaellin [Dysgonomonas hofstadii]